MRSHSYWKLSLAPSLAAAAMTLAGPLAAAEITLPGWGYDEPLALAGGRPALDVTIGGEGPFRFVLDTGAGKSAIDTGLAKRLGLEVVGHQRIGAPGLEGIEVELLRVEALEFDGVVVRDEPFIGLDLEEMTGGAFLGVVSLRALAEVTVELDFAGGRLRLDREGVDPAAEGVVEMRPGPVVEFSVTVAGQSLPAHLDTGSPGGLTFPRHLTAGLAMLREPVEVGRARLVGGESAVYEAQLADTVRLGALELEQPEIRILDLELPAVNVGSGLLSQMVVRLDQARGLMTLTAPAEGLGGGGGAGS